MAHSTSRLFFLGKRDGCASPGGVVAIAGATRELDRRVACALNRVPVPDRKGMVTSPYLPEDGKYIDVTDFAPRRVVKDPYTGKFFWFRKFDRERVAPLLGVESRSRRGRPYR